ALRERKMRDRDRKAARDDRECVKHQDGRTFRKPESDEPMRRVVAPALRDLSAPNFSHERNKRRVKDRDDEDQCRYGEDRQDPAAASAAACLVDEYRARQNEPDEHRSAIAHKDRCGIEVKDQKPKQSADKDRRKQQFVTLPDAQETCRKPDSADRGYSGGKAVHIVEQIDRIRDPDDPKARDPNVDDLVARQRHRQAEADQDRRTKKLAKQLLIRPNVENIVNQADRKKDRSAG